MSQPRRSARLAANATATAATDAAAVSDERYREQFRRVDYQL
jgi:hypothetical protein